MMLDDDPLEPELREAARAYHQPPGEPPREQIWAAIVARRTAELPPRERASRWSAVAWAAGIAAVLAIGVGIGRLTVRLTASPSRAPAAVPVAKAPRKEDVTAYRVATAEHLGQAEAFLTLFRSSVQQGDRGRLASSTARQLLATNRLLLDSPAAGDPRLRLLLQDLELVLAQIAQLGPERRGADVELIREGLDDGVLLRLRAAVPAGATGMSVRSRQGAL
jgi:uncharacterized membrane-anchored protein YhcB (DUF1043 family)